MKIWIIYSQGKCTAHFSYFNLWNSDVRLMRIDLRNPDNMNIVRVHRIGTHGIHNSENEKKKNLAVCWDREEAASRPKNHRSKYRPSTRRNRDVMVYLLIFHFFLFCFLFWMAHSFRAERHTMPSHHVSPGQFVWNM